MASMYGELGKLSTDGENVQCHLCGEWFRFLGSHVPQKHGITAKEYKREFGLRVQRGLMAQDLRETWGGQAAHLRVYDEQNAEFLRNAGKQFHREAGSSHIISLEERSEETWQQNKAKAIKAAQDKAAALRRSGELSGPQTEQQKAAFARARQRLEELRQDPEWRKEVGRRVWQSRRKAPRETRICPICSTEFEECASTKRRTCSATCAKEIKRRVARSNGTKSRGPHKVNT